MRGYKAYRSLLPVLKSDFNLPKIPLSRPNTSLPDAATDVGGLTRTISGVVAERLEARSDNQSRMNDLVEFLYVSESYIPSAPRHTPWTDRQSRLTSQTTRHMLTNGCSNTLPSPLLPPVGTSPSSTNSTSTSNIVLNEVRVDGFQCKFLNGSCALRPLIAALICFDGAGWEVYVSVTGAISPYVIDSDGVVRCIDQAETRTKDGRVHHFIIHCGGPVQAGLL